VGGVLRGQKRGEKGRPLDPDKKVEKRKKRKNSIFHEIEKTPDGREGRQQDMNDGGREGKDLQDRGGRGFHFSPSEEEGNVTVGKRGEQNRLTEKKMPVIEKGQSSDEKKLIAARSWLAVCKGKGGRAMSKKKRTPGGRELYGGKKENTAPQRGTLKKSKKLITTSLGFMI